MTQELKEALAWVFLITLIVVTIIAVSLGTWVVSNTINHSTSARAATSAQNNARKTFFQTCEKQFRTGVFNAGCVGAVSK